MTLALENFISKYVSEEWVVYLQKFTTEHRFLVGQKIFVEGEKVKGFYFINSGKVKVVSGPSEDNERLLRLSKEGELLGHRCISVEEYRCTAIALTETEVTFIPYRVFDKLIRGNPDFAYFVIDLLGDDLIYSENLVTNLCSSEVIARMISSFV